MKLKPDVNDLLGFAIFDFFKTGKDHALRVYINGKRDEDMRPSLFLRNYATMKGWERLALKMAKGSVLDIGAAAGCHSRILQGRGLDVTALEISPWSSQVATARGVQRVMNEDIFLVKGIEFNTILLLMNGLGVGQTEAGTAKLFKHLSKMLTKKGQIIGDSTDILYSNPEAQFHIGRKPYYGEVEFVLEYQGIKSVPFRWIYLDPSLLFELSDKAGLHCEIVHRDRDFHYLALLTKA